MKRTYGRKPTEFPSESTAVVETFWRRIPSLHLTGLLDASGRAIETSTPTTLGAGAGFEPLRGRARPPSLKSQAARSVQFGKPATADT